MSSPPGCGVDGGHVIGRRQLGQDIGIGVVHEHQEVVDAVGQIALRPAPQPLRGVLGGADGEDHAPSLGSNGLGPAHNPDVSTESSTSLAVPRSAARTCTQSSRLAVTWTTRSTVMPPSAQPVNSTVDVGVAVAAVVLRRSRHVALGVLRHASPAARCWEHAEEDALARVGVLVPACAGARRDRG